MDWFERLTGFRETSYYETRGRLEVRGGCLHSTKNGRSYDIGQLELPSLAELRQRLIEAPPPPGHLRFSNISGDVRALHRDVTYSRALFQVASQFNLLEMTGPEITPEQGVTRYEWDHTQGPACAIAAGAATVYRNYFAPVGEAEGQTAEHQLNTLADVGNLLSGSLGRHVDSLWRMSNGYALLFRHGLNAINQYLTSKPDLRDEVRARLRIGLHWDVEVTDMADVDARPRPRVSQAFCSALPVTYNDVPLDAWSPFGEVILEAAYEATLSAAVLNAVRGCAPIVLLTRLGGGAFGNPEEWIESALRRALRLFENYDLDVRLVSRGQTPPLMTELARDFA